MCGISKQIAEYANEDVKVCPYDGSELEEKRNVYGAWYVCIECDYETEQR